MRAETQRATEILVVELVVAVLHLAWLSQRFSTEQGSGGVTLLLGCTFTTGLLWAMLALRSLASDGALAPEIDDGVTSMAVTAALFVVAPPRAANFLPEGGVDDFTHVYVPICLLVVFVVLGAQALWRPRSVALVHVRWLASTAVSFGLLAGLFLTLAGGADAPALAARCGVAAVLCGAVAALLARSARPTGG